MNLEAFVLGSGGMMPLPGRHLTSVLLRREGDLFLFDCGEGTQVSLRRLNLRWKKISVIFISHIHADHVTGLPGMLMLSSQVDREEPLFIFGPPMIRDYVEANRKILAMYINYQIVVREIDSPGTVFEGDDFRVRAFSLNHTKQCYGFCLEENNRPGVFHPEKARDLGVPEGPLWAKLQGGQAITLPGGQMVESKEVLGPIRSGRKFSFVTDTLYSKTIAPEVSGSDLLICEGMFADNLEESAKEKKHLTARQAGRIARDAGGVKKLGLIHFSPRYTERDLKELLSEARSVFPGACLTRDRQAFPIPFRE